MSSQVCMALNLLDKGQISVDETICLLTAMRKKKTVNRPAVDFIPSISDSEKQCLAALFDMGNPEPYR